MFVVIAATTLVGALARADGKVSANTQKAEEAPADEESDAVFNAVFSPDGKLLAAGSYGGPTTIWNVEAGEQVQTLVGHESAVASLAFSPDGKWLVTGSFDASGAAIRWDMRTGKRLCKIEGHQGEIQSAAVSPDGKLIATGTDWGQILLSDAESGQTRRELRHSEKETGWPGYVHSLAFSPDGKMLASGSEDKTVMLWDVETGKRIRTLDGLTGGVTFAAFSQDGKRLAVATVRDGIVFWDVATGKKRRSIGASDNPCFAIVSPDWKTTVKVVGKGQISAFNIETGETVWRLEGLEAELVPRSFSPDGKLIAVVSLHDAELWDAKTGKKKCELRCSGRAN